MMITHNSTLLNGLPTIQRCCADCLWIISNPTTIDGRHEKYKSLFREDATAAQMLCGLINYIAIVTKEQA